MICNFFEKCENENVDVYNKLLEIQDHYNVSFPSEVVDLYVNYDISKLINRWFEYDKIDYGVDFIIPVISNDIETLDEYIESVHSNEFFSKELFPFFISQFGEPYLWNSSTNEMCILPEGEDKILVIAKSFSDFLELINKGREE